jgi:hypothetical protein
VAITTTFAQLEELLPAHIEVGAVRYLNYQVEGPICLAASCCPWLNPPQQA